MIRAHLTSTPCHALLQAWGAIFFAWMNNLFGPKRVQMNAFLFQSWEPISDQLSQISDQLLSCQTVWATRGNCSATAYPGLHDLQATMEATVQLPQTIISTPNSGSLARESKTNPLQHGINLS